MSLFYFISISFECDDIERSQGVEITEERHIQSRILILQSCCIVIAKIKCDYINYTGMWEISDWKCIKTELKYRYKKKITDENVIFHFAY